ncbi:hypothetical protein [Sodaliphilus sp.]|uniref:hypothetical protein n=1 Tax=Sodaliphilus sp. TaxID=2815818 RepID=UPI00388EAC90
MVPKIVNIDLPKSWAELTDAQLYYVYNLLAENLSGAQIKTYCLFLWAKIKIVCRYGDGYLLRKGKLEFYASAPIIHDAIHALDYIEDIARPMPVRISTIKKHKALDAQFIGVPFERFLYIDNLYQGYLHSQQHSLLDEMGNLLYDAEGLSLNRAEKMNVFYWWMALKDMFNARFPNFFVPVQSDDQNLMGNTKPISRQLQEAMDAQIRALTKGDITKEREVLAMDTWRALTELDALAKESEEIRRKYGTH